MYERTIDGMPMEYKRKTNRLQTDYKCTTNVSRTEYERTTNWLYTDYKGTTNRLHTECQRMRSKYGRATDGIHQYTNELRTNYKWNSNGIQTEYERTTNVRELSLSLVPVSPPVHFEGIKNHNVFSSVRGVSEQYLSERVVRCEQLVCLA